MRLNDKLAALDQIYAIYDRFIAGQENRQAYNKGKLDCLSTGLIQNQPLKILMIPPEHRTRMQPFLQSLRDIRF